MTENDTPSKANTCSVIAGLLFLAQIAVFVVEASTSTEPRMASGTKAIIIGLYVMSALFAVGGLLTPPKGLRWVAVIVLICFAMKIINSVRGGSW